MSTVAPKLRSKTIDTKDLGSAFPAEKVVGCNVRFKERTGWGYGSRTNYRIQIGENDTTIRGNLDAELNLEEITRLLGWLKANCVWHKTEVSYSDPKRSVLVNSFEVPAPNVARGYVNSVFHRKMTETQLADLAAVEQRRASRMAKQKAETKERAAKQRAEDKKHKAEQERRSASTEFSDLATALKVLKKHGLKIVTIEKKS